MENVSLSCYNSSTMLRVSEPDLIEIVGKPNFEFADFCRSVRLEEGLSQAQMAAKLSMTTRAYEKLESGDSNPSSDTLLALLIIRAKRRSINLKAIFL
ncbi:MAG: helix-turn-helix transcriptional regulator [Blastocatellia bacterium]